MHGVVPRTLSISGCKTWGGGQWINFNYINKLIRQTGPPRALQYFSPFISMVTQLHPSVFVGCWEVTGSWALWAAGSNVALKPHLEAFHRGDFGRQGPALGSRSVSSCSHLSSSSLNKNNTGLRMKGRTNRGKYISTGGFACMFPCWKNARIILRAHLQEAGVLSKGRVEGNPACSEHLCAEVRGWFLGRQRSPHPYSFPLPAAGCHRQGDVLGCA